MFEPSVSNDLTNYLLFALGAILSLKRVAEMERYHRLRVVLLTSILSCFVAYFFLMFSFTLGDPWAYDCMLEFDPAIDDM